MRKRVFQTITIVLALASLGVATFVAQKTTTTRSKAGAQRSGQGTATRRRAQRNTAAQTGPTRPADSNRAPQAAVDDALYTNEEFFGTNASVARPYSIALERVSSLLAKYPKDSRLHLHAARFAERLSQFDRAASEMAEYAELKGRSSDSLRRLADFYHDRARFADEVRTLQELAKNVPVGDRSAIYKRAAEIVRNHTLKEFKPADFFAELLAADPSNIQPVKNYVEELRLARQNKPALDVLAARQAEFPADLGYFLKTRASLLESTSGRRAAEEIYAASFDPKWPRAIAGDYFELLRKYGRYRIVRRGLQERVRGGATDLETVARLFSVFVYEGNYTQAAQLLRDLESRRAGKPSDVAQAASLRGNWNAGELDTVAGLFSSIGYYDQASRYLYTLYLVGGLEPGSQSREGALYRLFKVMLDAAGTPTRVASGNLSLYRDIAEVDEHPGFMNGVLSLILSGAEPAQQFATQEKAAAGYFNRTFAYRIFTSFKQEYAQSKHLPEMYLGTVNVFSSLGENKLAIEAGREFQKLFPDSPKYADVSLRIADSYVALKDRVHERAALAELLDKLAAERPKGTPLLPVAAKHWRYGMTPRVDKLIDRIKYKIEAYSDTYDPTSDKMEEVSSREEASEGSDSEDEDNNARFSVSESADSSRAGGYSSVLERYVSSLASEDKKTETVAFFWGEIKKHPKEEGLYERFMRWLGQAELVNEQLKAYNNAIREFDSNTWYHRMARWYVRQKRGKELARYSHQLIGIFDEEEITDYLLRFSGYGGAPEGDSLNWDAKLAFDLYGYAHTRFPRNLFFVRGMLTYLAENDRARWEKLSTEYYFADLSIREPYLAWLSKQNQLRDRLKRAEAPGGGGARAQGLTAYRVFAADAGLWMSHHDRALEAYRQLAAQYPGEPQYVERLGDLTRSFGQQSDKLYEESAGLFAQMADIYPAEHEYRIKAGEVYAQLGDFKRAGDEWNKLIQIEPGDRNTYLEVATVYWDYYQYDQSIRVFKDLRNVSGDQSIYAYRMGAVYEGKGEIDSAIAEYVKVLDEPGDGRDTVVKRLAQLSRRKGVAEKIAAAYQQAHAANPADWQMAIGYAFYQAEREHQADALAMLRSEIEKSNDVGFLESVRDLFRAILRPEDEQQVIGRLVAVARDEREAMMYRLQLAAFLERHNQVDAAVAAIDKLTVDYPTNLGVVEESAQFYWRAGLFDKSLGLYKRTIARAQGENRRNLTIKFARRQIDAGKLVDAEATLRTFYNENHSDTEAFGELARVLGAENKLTDLATLYQEAFKDAREAGLGGDETRSRVVELRRAMIATLDSLDKHQDAVDQHIEIINAFPEDFEALASAIDYSEQHGLIERLTAYYEKLSKGSYKNYRWQLVLGRIYERRGNLAGAADQYKIAVVNEPQRPDLRFTLASVLTRQRRFDEAIAVLREGWSLAGRDPSWLIEVARIQVQQGNRDEAVKTIRQAIAAKKNPAAELRLSMAARLASWSINDEAARMYEEVFNNLPRTLKDEIVAASDLTGYVRVLLLTEPADSAYQKLERMRAQFLAIGQNSKDTDSYKAKSIVSAIDSAMRSDFGKGVLDYSAGSESSALASAMQASVAKLTTYADAEALRRYLGIARAAGLVEVEELIQTRLKDAAFTARPKSINPSPQDSQYYGELRALVTFYGRHAQFVKAAEMLVAELKRDPYKDRFDYQSQIAAQYRLAGDESRELSALRAAYAGATGDLTPNTSDWVDRYLSLLYSTANKNEVQRLAASYNPHQLQLINLLIEKNEKDLARVAVENANRPQAWVASRSAELGLFLKDTSPDIETFFRTALDMKPIGQMIHRKVDRNKNLIGDDWWVASRNYGYWLATVGRENDSRKFALGEVEGHPTVARAQLELAAYYLDRKNTSRAGDHVALAAELAPGTSDVAVMKGTIALARKDTKAALEAWNSMMASRVSVADADRYLKVMADNGFLRDAMPQIENFIVTVVNRALRDKNGEASLESVKPLIRNIAARAGKDARLASDIGAFFNSVIQKTPGDQMIGRLLVEERLLPESQLGSVYRSIHQRLSDNAAAVFGTAQYDNGYYNGALFVYPAKELAEWRHGLLDYLIRTRSFDEARLLVSTIRQEQAEIARAIEKHGGDEENAAEDRYEWLPLAAALIELRGGRDAAKAVAELRRYCGLDSAQTPGDQANRGPAHDRCLKAYALLLAEHRDADAETLLYDSYRAVARTRYADDASLVGLAEIESRRGRADEASRLLKLMVERSTDNLRALKLAAETAARISRLDQAIEYRQQIVQANPSDATNKLELARELAAVSRGPDAMDTLVALIAERATPNSVRAQAAEIAGEIVRADRSLASRASKFGDLAAQGSAAAALARGAIAVATGSVEEARSSLSGISGPLAAIAQTKLGELALAAHRDQEAIESFERAINLDADGELTDAIAFRAASPRAQLILLYGKTGRDLAALRFAEGDDPTGRKLFLSPAVRNALVVGNVQAQSASTAFEPPLEITRSKITGLKTVAELNQFAALRIQTELLGSLVESAARLGRYDRAIALDRLRVAEATKPEEKVAIEKRLEEIIAVERARHLRLASAVRFDRSNATASIYAARMN